ncbi:MAG: SDR family oxidoreductase, partial [Rhodobacteraceae bacterium]|nr:SDR family oxidoreductase [Paracoccaceae bacterium]
AIPGDGAYGITKSGVERMTAFMANELAGTGIRVNGIAPGYIKTPLTKHVWGDPEVLKAAEADVPLGRMAEPEEVANLVLFVASDLGSYMHGHTILVDGGRIAGNPG